MTQHKQPSNQRFTQRWRSIATAALLACVFLLPAFAAQAQVNTQITATQQSPNPSAINQQVTFVVTVTAASGSASPTGTVNLFNITSGASQIGTRSEEHTSELQSLTNLVCRLLLEKK